MTGWMVWLLDRIKDIDREAMVVVRMPIRPSTAVAPSVKGLRLHTNRSSTKDLLNPSRTLRQRGCQRENRALPASLIAYIFPR